MCLNNENVSQAELDMLKALVEELPPSSKLGEFLGMIHRLIADGDGLCMAPMPDMPGDEMRPIPPGLPFVGGEPEGDGPAPGIYLI